MTKREFMDAWRINRTAALKRMYAGDPHGPACLAASLVDVDKEGNKLWRKYRSTLKDCTPSQVFVPRQSQAIEDEIVKVIG